MAPSPLDDEHAPLFTVGQVAEMLAVKQAFLRRVDDLQVVSPQRSAGGQRRYTRYEIRVIQQVVSMADEGITLLAIRRIIELERQLATVTAERDELARRLAELLLYLTARARAVPQPRAPAWSAPGASASSSSTGSASASAERWARVSSRRLAASSSVVWVRSRSSVSRPREVMARVLARASLGSACRRT
jgi:DNA-binding transcriptional MerR regulator